MTNKISLSSLSRLFLSGLLLLVSHSPQPRRPRRAAFMVPWPTPQARLSPRQRSRSPARTAPRASPSAAETAPRHRQPRAWPYTISVSAEGFAPSQSGPSAGFAGKNTLLNVALQMPVATQEVTVSDDPTSASTPVQTTTPAPSSSKARISTRSPTIPTSCRANSTRWPVPPPDPTADRSISMASPAASFRPSPRSAKSASIRIHFQRNTTSSATGASRFSPSPAPTSFTACFMMNGNDSAFNSLNPFVTSEPSYYTTFMMGNAGGALSKNGSWFGSVFDRNNHSNSIINAELLDSNGILTTIPRRLPTRSRAST